MTGTSTPVLSSLIQQHRASCTGKRPTAYSIEMGDAGTATNTLADPPSTNPPPTDPPVTIDDADILSVEQAVDGLLNKVQADLGFPYSTDTNPAPPSTTLTYRFNAGIEVSLDTEWSLFAGLTLTNITLRAEVDKFKGTPGM